MPDATNPTPLPSTAEAAGATKLLPCPFCGGEGGAMRRAGGPWRVWCLRPTSVCGLIGPDKDTAADACVHWNARPPFPAALVMREALESIIEQDDDAARAKGKPGANLNGVGLVDLFDCVGHPFGAGKNQQQPCRSNNLVAALADSRKAIALAKAAGIGG